jgi:aryl-alcohol dehydrogenase-like predicted oxidoreductase
MADLDRLSRIGFGGHLITIRSPEHREALVRALQLGCNVLDTSANYMEGESERLIGQVLAENPQIDAFVITKSGVVIGSEYDTVDRHAADPDGPSAVDFLHPDALRSRIMVSLERLQRGHIDAYLLHNPEVQLGGGEDALSQDEFYARIERAFAFLEDLVDKGTVRYYGISSNTFHLPTTNPTTINLHRVLKLSRAVSSKSHFKFIEFPFNLVETGATQAHHDQISLVELARSNGLITLSNRPLNANTPAGALRLALYPEDLVSISEERDCAVFEDCLERIRCQLRAIGQPDDPLAFWVVQYLNKHWMEIGNPEAVEQIFHEYLHPFLMRLYGESFPAEDRVIYTVLYQVVLRHARRNRARRTQRFRDALVQEGDLPRGDRPLPLVVCERYLRAGIDCVLVGMRKARYVESLKPLFFHAAAGVIALVGPVVMAAGV